ncbi:T6SS phospholipase effector Tle1-like catalytic domain-containing protein [Pseudomonas putida]|uniref:T6SS phospholipase effector Tle1-like catalytic domain-containing protein n=1 Tax=Pseudomonas putida TaxID=303 RepID=UPI003570A5B9
MSKTNKARVWLPPHFPVQGRLPQRVEQVRHNLRLREQPARDHQDSLCLVAGYRLPPPCSRTLHISLFFDGTGNNLNNDLFESAVPHPTNIARLFRATIGAGHAGGTAHRSNGTSGLTDAPGTGNGDYYKYYMPGVGTPFPEVGDLDYTTEGLAFARRGEERINWGLLMIIDALRRVLGLPHLDNAALKTAVEDMGTWLGTEWIKGRSNRRKEFYEQLSAIERTLEIALEGTSAAQPKLLGVRLYVYGFSRGAASARAFVNWLNELLAPNESTPGLVVGKRKLPISVEYLGLLDTVVSVGLADIAPGPTGHMGWGDGSQALPSGALLKRCLHIVASHEQRLSFPLDSIRREDGSYPANCVEVIYPGVHSDQGGGYPPGDQGKAVGLQDDLLLSQIALNDLYADAFARGAPLKVPPHVLPVGLQNEVWRAMEPDVLLEFDVESLLVSRFNAWRQATLSLTAPPQTHAPEQFERYEVSQAPVSLEEALRIQLAWITAWRIDRYAFASFEDTQFYRNASDTHGTEDARKRAEAEREQQQAKVQARRLQQIARERKGAPSMPLEPGIPDFDPDRAQSQLREAAKEFEKSYRNLDSDPYLTVLRIAKEVNPTAWLIYRNSAETRAERERVKAAGRAKVSQLFPPPSGERNHLTERSRGNVEEHRNSQKPEGLLRALFDDQVHDSRAWFLHAVLNNRYLGVSLSAGREPWGSYFNERMVFFGEADRRDLALIVRPDGEPAPAVSIAQISGYTLKLPVENAQHRAQLQQRITAVWDAHYATASEVGNGLG